MCVKRRPVVRFALDMVRDADLSYKPLWFELGKIYAILQVKCPGAIWDGLNEFIKA